MKTGLEDLKYYYNNNHCPDCGGMVLHSLLDTSTFNSLFDDWAKQVYETKGKGAKINRDMYLATANKFTEAIMQGIGGIPASYDAPINLLAAKMKYNMHVFSGAKTMHQQQAMSAALFDQNGKPLTYKMFRTEVDKINPLYNETWLKTEYETAILQAEAVVDWEKIQANKHVHGCLQYKTMEDASVRPEHQPLNNIKLPVDATFWKTYFPPNGWNCRCKAIQVDCGNAAMNDDEAQRMAKKAKLPKAFKNNPAERLMQHDENDTPYFRLNNKGKPQELDAEKDYGMRSYEAIMKDLPSHPIKLPKPKSKEEFLQWWENKVKENPAGGSNFQITDKMGNKILFDAAPNANKGNFFREHVKNRHEYAWQCESVVKNPDEAWAFNQKGKLHHFYLKYYQNKIFTVIVSENGAILKAETFVDATNNKNYFNNLRKGMLMYANKKF